jgi:sortase A
MAVGDEVVVTTTQGQSLYEVTEISKVSIDRGGPDDGESTGSQGPPSDADDEGAVPVDELYGPTEADQLTLVTSASPMPWASERATVVVAEMQTEPFRPTPQNGRSDDGTGLTGEDGALASVLIALVAYGVVMGGAILLYRRLTPTTAYVLAIAPVLALTVIAAETISRLFPAWM